MDRIIKRKLSYSELNIYVQVLGSDYCLTVAGGEKPHIGCTVISIPRASLTGSGEISCTSSVINVTGHQDEVICRYLAEAVCKRYQAVTVCSGGFHMDGITEIQIRELMDAVSDCLNEI